MTHIHITRFAVALVCAAGLASCKTGDMAQSLVGAASLATTLDVSKTRQRKLGHSAAVHINKTSLMSEDKVLIGYLNKMLGRLVAASEAPPEYAYRLDVVEDTALNAFTPGGGHVFVTTGLMRALDNEAQMAAVIAHELAHITESHVVRGIRDKAGMQVAANLGASAIGIDTAMTRVVYDYSVLAAVNGHGRRFEMEADFLGLETMIKAGYDPHESVKVFQALARMYGDRSELATFFHGSHPTNQKRIETINKLIADNYPGLERASLVRDTKAYARIKARYPNTMTN